MSKFLADTPCNKRIKKEKQKFDFPGSSDSKASVYNAGDLGSIPGSGRIPGEVNGNPLQYSCLENPMDGGAWCPWGRKESDTTEQLHFTYPIYTWEILKQTD